MFCVSSNDQTVCTQCPRTSMSCRPHIILLTTSTNLHIAVTFPGGEFHVKLASDLFVLCLYEITGIH